MAIDKNTGTLIRDLVEQVRAEEPATRRKANTVTTVTGAVLTGLATIGTELVSSGLDLPPWFSLVVMALGLAATAFGVSKTTNGMTDSVADRLELELARRIDLNHDHSDVVLTADKGISDPADLRAAADALANDLFGRHRVS